MAFDLDQLMNLMNSAKEKGVELLGLAKEKGTEFADTAKERGVGIAGLAVEKTKEAAKIAKLTMELASEKEALKKAYVELGKAFYEENRAGAEGLLAQLCEEVEAVDARIESIQTEIDDAKASLRSSSETADFEEVVSQDEDGDITVEITEEPEEKTEE